MEENIQNPQSQVTRDDQSRLSPEQVTSEVKPKKNKLLLIVIVLLFLIIIALVAYLFIENRALKESLNNLENTQLAIEATIEDSDSSSNESMVDESDEIIDEIEVEGIVQESDKPMPLLSGQKRYISETWGLEFLYMEEQGDEFGSDIGGTIVSEIDNIVYIHTEVTSPDSGQYIEMFKKDPDITFKEALEQEFLRTTEYREVCEISEDIMMVSDSSVPNTFQMLTIDFKDRPADLEELFENYEKCPGPYTRSNGISYFVYDPSYPDKYGFVSGGQDAIIASKDSTWQDTLRFTSVN